MSTMSIFLHASTMEDEMAQWQTAEAKQRFSAMVEAAELEGPQVVMRHKDPVAVLLSADAYRALVREAGANFGALLADSPFEPGDLHGFKISLNGEDDQDRAETEASVTLKRAAR